MDTGLYCASAGFKDIDKKFTVGTVQSLIKHDFNPKLIIVDECHNISDDEESWYQLLLKLNFDAKVAGFTATTFRSDGGNIYGTDKIFPRLNFYRGLIYMIENGYLVRPILRQGKHSFDISKLRISMGDYAKGDLERLTSNRNQATAQVQDALLNLKGRKKVVWAASSIKHAELICENLKNFNEEYSIIHSKLSYDLQLENKKHFEEGSARHMVFVTMLKEGYDYKPIDAVVFMRPTRSPVLYVQICGRGLRPYPGKENCLILDYGRVVENLGPLNNPEIPDVRKKKNKEELDDKTIKACPKCATYIPKETEQCEFCGHVFTRPTVSKNLTQTAAHLGELLSNESKSKKFMLGSIDVTPHKAKSGNDCTKISFFEKSIMGKSGYPLVTEYFSINYPFAVQKLSNMLVALNVNVNDIVTVETKDYNFSIEYPHDVEVEYKKDGDYPKVIRITNREPNTRLSSHLF